MERGVEAGDLRQVRLGGQQSPDQREIVWLMQRCERNQCFKLVQHTDINPHRRGEALAAVDHAMPHRANSMPLQHVRNRLHQVRQCLVIVQRSALLPYASLHHVAGSVLDDETGRIGANIPDTSRQQSLQPRVMGVEHRELDAR
jgi:hypothetical protein